MRLLFVAAAALSAAGGVSAAPPQANPPHKPGCAAAPVVDTGALARQKQAAGQVVANFLAAYRQACAKGLLRDRPLISPGSRPPGKLFLLNAPDANVASIYNDSDEGARPGRMVLEYPFVTADRRVHVPGRDELEEAIYCAVHGATSEEDEGRCLAD